MQNIIKTISAMTFSSFLVMPTILLADDAQESQVTGETIEEVVVQGLSSLQQRLGESGSISVIDTQTVRDVAATHPSEVLNRVPGVWINRGSGQEHSPPYAQRYTQAQEPAVSLLCSKMVFPCGLRGFATSIIYSSLILSRRKPSRFGGVPPVRCWVVMRCMARST